ncbi:unnamed protein product [Linum trigynum]|uniref:Uncharacterized protein n=1 Tax=Linum trigynum TaxID=586398 RepID=A0AAV2CPU7_9ROSI
MSFCCNDVRVTVRGFCEATKRIAEFKKLQQERDRRRREAGPTTQASSSGAVTGSSVLPRSTAVTPEGREAAAVTVAVPVFLKPACSHAAIEKLQDSKPSPPLLKSLDASPADVVDAAAAPHGLGEFKEEAINTPAARNKDSAPSNFPFAIDISLHPYILIELVVREDE